MRPETDAEDSRTDNRQKRDGTENPKSGQWTATAPIIVNGEPWAIVGASAQTSGYAHVVCFGGVNRDIFLKAL